MGIFCQRLHLSASSVWVFVFEVFLFLELLLLLNDAFILFSLFSYFFQSILKNCKEIPVEFFGATCGVWSLLNETFWVLTLILQLVAILINRIWRRESQAKLPSAPLKFSPASREKVLPWNAKAADASHALYDLEGKLGETEMFASCGTIRWRKMPNQKPILRHILGDEI